MTVEVEHRGETFKVEGFIVPMVDSSCFDPLDGSNCDSAVHVVIARQDCGWRILADTYTKRVGTVSMEALYDDHVYDSGMGTSRWKEECDDIMDMYHADVERYEKELRKYNAVIHQYDCDYMRWRETPWGSRGDMPRLKEMVKPERPADPVMPEKPVYAGTPSRHRSLMIVSGDEYLRLSHPSGSFVDDAKRSAVFGFVWIDDESEIPEDAWGESMRVMVEAYAAWLRGDIYDLIVRVDGVVEDACSGFYMYDKAEMEWTSGELKAMVDSAAASLVDTLRARKIGALKSVLSDALRTFPDEASQAVEEAMVSFVRVAAAE